MAKRFAALLATAAAMVLLLCTATAWAGPVTINDDAKVLDATQVTNAGNALPYPVQVFTTENNANDNAAFDKEAQSHVNGPTDIVIAINTKSRHLTIRTGRDSHIRNGAPAVAAFKSAFGSGNYTGATVAALQSLNSAIGQGGPVRSPAPARQVHHTSAMWGLLCPLIIVALLVFTVVSLFRGRRSGSGMIGGGMFNRSSAPGPYGPPPGPGGPVYGGGRGMGPGVAGGLGAVGGGLLGYELGKMEGERGERRDQGFDQSGGYVGGDSQQWGGGGGDGDFGGGDGGDFGGGGGSSSDSSNF